MDAQLEELLDKAVPASTLDAARGWRDVLTRAGLAEAPPTPVARRRFRGWAPPRPVFRLAFAATVAAVAALVGFSLLPGGNGCGKVLSCAAAAVKGDGAIVHMVFRVPSPSDHPGYTGYEVWYDTENNAAHTLSRNTVTGETSQSWSTATGVYIRHRGELKRLDRATIADDISKEVVQLFGRYRDQLQNGQATLVGEASFESKPAYAIDFLVDQPVNPVSGKKGQVYQRVLVDRDTYAPLAWAYATRDGRLIPMLHPKTLKPWFTWVRIELAQFEERDPAMFEVPNS